MMRAICIAIIFVLGMVVTLGSANTVEAQQLPQPTAAELCRQFDEQGLLDLIGNTRGECVNVLSGPASEEAAYRIAAICGRENIWLILGVENKGQCIQALQGP